MYCIFSSDHFYCIIVLCISLTKTKRHRFRQGGEQHAWGNVTEDLADLAGNVLVWEAILALVRLNQDEDVVYSDSQYQERNNFDYDERGRLAKVTPETQRGDDGAEDDQDATKAEREL